MGHKHTRTEILDGAVRVAFEDGLSQLSFGRVAKRLGISDRIVVYYFPTKDDLVGDVLTAMGTQLQAALLPAFASPAADHMELLSRAWPILARPDADRIFALFFEASGLAATDREPYRTLVPQVVEAWITWAAALIRGRPAQRRAQAEAAVAILDGLLLLRQIAGPEVADRAVRAIRRNAAAPGARAARRP
jgi:AcrR family transcriptional regulator